MEKTTKWTDTLVILGSLMIIGLSGWWMFTSGVFNLSLQSDTKITWHLIRASGIIAYLLVMASTIWGLFLSGQFVKDWSPGPISITLHSTASWLAVVLSLGHAALLMFDDYFAYTLGDVFIPFVGPYRPEAVGLGTLAFWLMVIISISFPFKRRIGNVMWQRLHYLSYAAYGMISLHGLFAGTDGERLGFRLLIGGGVMTVLLLLGIRMGKDQANDQAKEKASAARAKPARAPRGETKPAVQTASDEGE
jgi:DMSO/TMAO reductase YedYZ heme-binding membrane subunit